MGTRFLWCVNSLCCFLWVLQKSNSPFKRKPLGDQIKEGEIWSGDETGRDNYLQEPPHQRQNHRVSLLEASYTSPLAIREGVPTADVHDGGSREGAGGAILTHPLGRGLVSVTASWAGPGFIFTGENAPTEERTFGTVSLIGFRAVHELWSMSVVRRDPVTAQRKSRPLQISSCFAVHSFSYRSSWLPSPCESTFTVK